MEKIQLCKLMTFIFPFYPKLSRFSHLPFRNLRVNIFWVFTSFHIFSIRVNCKLSITKKGKITGKEIDVNSMTWLKLLNEYVWHSCVNKFGKFKVKIGFLCVMRR